MAETKVCLGGCDSAAKPLSAFYQHSQMADGYLNYCKECVRRRVRRYAAANPEKIRLLTREKHRRPEYRAKEVEWNRGHPEARQRIRLRWAKANGEKRKAQQMVGNAVRDGKIKKLKSCQECGRTSGIEAHHPNYSKPLEVVWLCTECHGKTRHKS